MAAADHCLAMFTIGDSPEAYRRMTEALRMLDQEITDGKYLKYSQYSESPDVPGNSAQKEISTVESGREVSLYDICPEAVIPLAAAWDRAKKEIPLSQAAGRTAGEFVNLYPPGIPILVPGERIEAIHCRMLAEYVRDGLNVQGVTDEAPYQIKVVK